MTCGTPTSSRLFSTSHLHCINLENLQPSKGWLHLACISFIVSCSFVKEVFVCLVVLLGIEGLIRHMLTNSAPALWYVALDGLKLYILTHWSFIRSYVSGRVEEGILFSSFACESTVISK